MTPTITIAWENIKTTPELEVPYLKPWLLPGETTRVTLGPNSPWQKYQGVFQIDCIYPIEQGHGDAKTKADAICSRFSIGATCSYNGEVVTIIKSYPNSGDNDGPYYKVSVSVVYECYSNT
jgi:hypothetical protein